MEKICKTCGISFNGRKSRKYCSLKCSAKYTTPIAAKASHKIPRIGINNPNWKGGRSINKYYYKKIQKKRYPIKVKARELVNKAIKSGKLIKPNVCRNCNKNILDKTKLHGHHEDYNKPLEVIWLCKKCHDNK